MIIWLCDDCKSDLVKAIAFLETSIKENNFTDIRYYSSLKPTKNSIPYNIDIAIIDIEMPLDGFSVADMVVAKDKKPLIIYNSSYNQYVKQSIKHKAFRFVDKNKYAEFNEALVAAYTYIKDHSIVITEDYEKTDINISDIVYFKSCSGGTKIFLSSGETKFTYKTIKALNAELSRFILIKRGRLVNLDYIVKIKKKSCKAVVEYQNQEYQISISKEKYKEIVLKIVNSLY